MRSRREASTARVSFISGLIARNEGRACRGARSRLRASLGLVRRRAAVAVVALRSTARCSKEVAKCVDLHFVSSLALVRGDIGVLAGIVGPVRIPGSIFPRHPLCLLGPLLVLIVSLFAGIVDLGIVICGAEIVLEVMFLLRSSCGGGVHSVEGHDRHGRFLGGVVPFGLRALD